ncbi:uncharacterized protein LOC120271516 [Dioscorea cayenensis subsp. rotundata]|uniref:Uncharacterized protein LOC120271516 n=1 Tax=Dioscorea cayennensis subsp. rotundata TaxID=55577 RepID=A0AB40C314_DIOCR|nr:uncharacterized protein LOC120271516 [Dioscorea cayenensis subsp. rotundata]
MSKVLATRLSKVIESLIDKSQTTFIKGRCFLDNILAAKELIFSLQKRKILGHIVKVDFAKAFHMVDWYFLDELLHAYGFGERWAGWIKAILVSSKANFIINGDKSGYVRYLRGLLQGDPLFLLALLWSLMCSA